MVYLFFFRDDSKSVESSSCKKETNSSVSIYKVASSLLDLIIKFKTPFITGIVLANGVEIATDYYGTVQSNVSLIVYSVLYFMLVSKKKKIFFVQE